MIYFNLFISLTKFFLTLSLLLKKNWSLISTTFHFHSILQLSPLTFHLFFNFFFFNLERCRPSFLLLLRKPTFLYYACRSVTISPCQTWLQKHVHQGHTLVFLKLKLMCMWVIWLESIILFHIIFVNQVHLKTYLKRILITYIMLSFTLHSHAMNLGPSLELNYLDIKWRSSYIARQ